MISKPLRFFSRFQRLLSSSRSMSSTEPSTKSRVPPNGPGLEHFIANGVRRRPVQRTPVEDHPYISNELMHGQGRKVYFDVYGCQMNVSDTEVVWSVLNEAGYEMTKDPKEADVWMVVTCSIREGAEQKIWKKLHHIKVNKGKAFRPTLKVGILGCMAERLKDKLLDADKLVDVVAGPDSYRDLPRLLAITEHGDQSAINVVLSLEETYADVTPMRLNDDKVTGFVSIQRGCDNMCSYCIVPFTRGRERSRPVASILAEVAHLAEAGVREVTLLGQNVNSYRDTAEESISMFGGNTKEKTENALGFKTIYKPKLGGLRFSDLLDRVSSVHPEVRIRFTSPHPKDFPDQVLQLIAERSNICKQLHLPAQSGSTKILSSMRRGYSREAYLDLVSRVRTIVPNVTLSSDFIAGFCGETDADFEETLSLIEEVRYHKLFLFPYSLRQKTHAHRKLSDDVPLEVKTDRFRRMDALYRTLVRDLNAELVGTTQLVLIEGDSKRSDKDFQGRTDGNIITIVPKEEGVRPGDYCLVRVSDSTALTLRGRIVEKTSLVMQQQSVQ